MNQVTDAARISAVFTDPCIWPHISDDGSPAREDWQPVICEGVVYLMPDDGSACFMLHQHTSVHWEVHSAVLPHARGQSIELAREGLEWMRLKKGARVISTYVPRGNYAAKALALKAGFKVVGVVPQSLLRGGIPVDQTLYAKEL